MKLKMLRDCKGTESGFKVKDYKKGEIYDLSDTLANDFIDLGYVELPADEIVKDEPKTQVKKIDAAPYNKSLGDAKKNKSEKDKKDKK